MNEDKIIERIGLLLRKAESTTPQEAVALTEHAERLMIRHGIDQARLAAAGTDRDVKADPVVIRRVRFTGTYAGAQVTSGAFIAEALGGIRALQSRDQGGKTLILVGHASDAARAELLVSSLRLQAGTALSAWWKANPYLRRVLSSWEQTKVRRDFLTSFAVEAARRIEATYRAAVAETAGTGTDLVLRDRGAAVNDFVTAEWPRLSKCRGEQYSGLHAGYEAGRRANIGGTELDASRPALAEGGR